MSNCSVVRSEVLVPGVPFGTFRYLASERGQFSLRSDQGRNKVGNPTADGPLNE